MSEALPEACLDQLFRAARTHNTWQDRDVPDELLHSIVDLLKLGPTSANCSPARFVFVKSPEAKQRLKPHLSEGNRDKTMKAPICTIIGYDPISIITCRSCFRMPTQRAGSQVTRPRSPRPRSATARCKAPI